MKIFFDVVFRDEEREEWEEEWEWDFECRLGGR